MVAWQISPPGVCVKTWPMRFSLDLVILMSMKKTRKTGQVSANVNSKHTALTWREERFVEAYIDNGGNGTQAALRTLEVSTYASAADAACTMLKKPYIIDAIANSRAETSRILKFNRADALKIYLGMALATADEFTQVLKDPRVPDNYRGLGNKKHAIKSVKHSHKHGNEVTFVDKKAALDELWNKLGLGKEASAGNWFDGFEQLADFIRDAKGKK